MKAKILKQRIAGLEAKVNQYEYEYTIDLLQDLQLLNYMKAMLANKKAKKLLIAGTVVVIGLTAYESLKPTHD